MNTASLFLKLCRALALGATMVSANLVSAETGYRWVVLPTYDDAGSAFEGVVPLRQGDLWGLMGSTGEWRISPRYEALGRPSDGHIPVKIDGKWGIVDLDGATLISPVYDHIGQWAERIPAKTSRGWMVLDKRGKEVYGPLPIDRLRGNEGHCIAGQIGERAYVFDDRTGYARGNPDPYATTKNPMRLYRPSAGVIPFKRDDDAGFISCGWLGIIEGSKAEAVRRAVPDNQLAAFKENGLWGLMSVGDTGAREVFPAIHQGMREYTEHRVPVKDDSGKWGYLNASGELEIAAKFDQAYSFSDGAAGVKVGDKRGFILPDGTYAARPEFEDFWRHAQGIAPVKLNGKWGVIALNATAPSQERGFDVSALAVTAVKDAPPNVRMSRPHSYFRQDYFNVMKVTFSTDGALAATLLNESEDAEPNPFSEIAVWDVSSRMMVSRFFAPELQVAAFLPDARRMVIGGVDGSISFHDTLSGTELVSIRPSLFPIKTISIDGTGRHLAASDGKATWIWDLENGAETARLTRGFDKLAPTKDAAGVFAAHSDGTIQQLDAATGKPLSQDRLNVIEGPKRIAIGPDGEVALGAEPDWRRGYDAFDLTVASAAGLQTNPAFSDEGLFALDFSSDGDRLVLATPEMLRLVDPDTAQVATEIPAYELLDSVSGEQQRLPPIDTLAFIPGTRDLLLVGTEGAPIMTIDPEARRITGTFGFQTASSYYGVVSVTAGDKIFVAPHDGDLFVFDPAATPPLSRFKGTLPAMSDTIETIPLASDGKNTVFYGVDGDVIAIDAGTLKTRPASENTAFARTDEVPAQHRTVLGDLGLPDYRTRVGELAGGRILFLGRSSGVHEFYDTETGKRVAHMALLDGEDWVIWTAFGFFDGTLGGIQALAAVEGLNARPVAETIPRYHRPDMVRAVLQGGSYSAELETIRLQQTAAAAPTEPPAVTPPQLPGISTVTTEQPETTSETPQPAATPNLPALNLSLGEGDAEQPPTRPTVPQPSLPGLSLSTDGTE